MHKMDLRLFFGCVLFLVLKVRCDEEPLCIMTAPNQVRPMSTYTVRVSLHNVKTPVNIKVKVNGEKRSIGEKNIQPNESAAEIKLEIGEWEEVYRLEIIGNGVGLHFRSVRTLNYNPKRSSTFIQTDKAAYQQSQKVQFRVFVIDDELKPFPANITVYITDPQDNRIKQYVHATLEKGVFIGDLQLSDRPLLGTWNIKATVESTETTKSFSVEEYVLPTYDVIITPPPFAIYNDTASLIRVQAKYTFGKPVRGTVQLFITDDCHRNGIHECLVRPKINTTLGTGGQVVIPLDVSRIRFPENYYALPTTMNLLAIVTEELTGNTMNASTTLNIYPHKEKLVLTSTREKFRPELPFTITATLSDQDNKPLINPDAPIQFNITYFGTNYNSINDNRWLNGINVPTNGMVSLALQPPASTTSITVDANYKNLIYTSKRFESVKHTDSKKYILVKTNNYNYHHVGNILTFHIYTTFDVEELSYRVVSGGDIVDSNTLKFPATTAHQIHVNLTHELSTKSRFIVYTVVENNEIIADSVDFAVGDFLKTPVKVSANPHETEPGALVEVEVNSNPSAMVYLLGIDQNVLLHKSGNDITKEEVEKDFAKYAGPITEAMQWNFLNPSYTDINQLFENAGVVFMTSSDRLRNYFWHWSSPDVMGRARNSEPAYLAIGLRGETGSQGLDSEPVDLSAPSMPKQTSQPEPEPIKLRQNFPETWIWKSISVRNDGKAIFNATAPDTITSWIINAIAMDENTGLGLSESSAKVTVFKPFFVSLNLPFSVVRGETLKLQALVFNYFKEDLEADVTLFNDNDDFQFTNCTNDSTTSCTTTLTIPAGDAASAVFPIVFNTIGYAKIKVSAFSVSTIMAGDAIQKELIVKAEGTTKYFNEAVLIQSRHGRKWSSEVEIKVPEDMVPDSERVEVSVIGDILGLAINNMDKLLRVPYGCGEQNMINFVPNIVAANYLRDIGELTDERKAKAISNIEAGYQRELNYKHDDGSYSAFGKSDSKGSTWLTAYVMKSFAQAKSYIPVKDDIIDKGLQFLKSVQNSDGTFAEHGKVIHKAMQGGIQSSGLAMTAYITIAFLQIGNPKYNSTVSKAISALEVRLPNATDPYEVAMITYALHLGKSKSKDIAFHQLKKLSTKEGKLLYWNKLANKNKDHQQKSSTDAISSLNVETTGYSLLTYAYRNIIKKAIPIVHWMVGQRNEFGGFASTQDTVIGLEALSTIAGKLTLDINSTVNVDVRYGGRAKTFSVSKENSLVLQQETLPTDTQLVEISATGKGACMLQVTWSYNVFNPGSPGTFSVTAEAGLQDGDNYKLTVCARYHDEDDESSNMAIIQLNTLSGYSFDKENEPTGSKKVEYDLSKTRLNLYYDQIDGNETCVTATAIRNNEIEELKDAEVVVYDYYQQEKKATAYYNIHRIEEEEETLDYIISL